MNRRKIVIQTSNNNSENLIKSYLTRSWAVPGTWQTSQACISLVSFEFELVVVTGVDVRLFDVAFDGLNKTDKRRVRTGGVEIGFAIHSFWFGVFGGGDDTVDGGDFGD